MHPSNLRGKMGSAVNALDFWGGVRTSRKMALFESIPNLKASNPFFSFAGLRLLWWFPAPLGESDPIPMYLKSQHKSQAFDFLLLICHYELGKTFSKSLQQFPWYHHQKLRHFALSLMELHSSASPHPPTPISMHHCQGRSFEGFGNSHPARPQSPLSNPSFRFLSPAMFINNHRILYQMGGIWPLPHRHI